MKPSRPVSKRVRILFPVDRLHSLIASIAPGAIRLLGFLFFGNLLKEMRRDRAPRQHRPQRADRHHHDPARPQRRCLHGRSPLLHRRFHSRSLCPWRASASASRRRRACSSPRLMNALVFKNNKLNPIIGAAGVSAVPDSARVCQMVGAREDPHQLPDHARDGPQRRWRDRLGRGGGDLFGPLRLQAAGLIRAARALSACVARPAAPSVCGSRRGRSPVWRSCAPGCNPRGRSPGRASGSRRPRRAHPRSCCSFAKPGRA
jgi:hypothetical protein